MFYRSPIFLRLTLVLLVLFTAIRGFAKDHSAEYKVGIFSSTGELSDGSYMNCSGRGCASYNAGHNIHYVRTADGMFAIEAPISVGKTLLLGTLTDGIAPTIHKEWFMDQLHEGDKVLFASKCNKHNNCEFWLPNPDSVGKEFISVGYYRADVAKTNTQTLCGKGKLTPEVEAQVCPSTAPGILAPITPPSPPADATTATPKPTRL